MGAARLLLMEIIYINHCKTDLLPPVSCDRTSFGLLEGLLASDNDTRKALYIWGGWDGNTLHAVIPHRLHSFLLLLPI